MKRRPSHGCGSRDCATYRCGRAGQGQCPTQWRHLNAGCHRDSSPGRSGSTFVQAPVPGPAGMPAGSPRQQPATPGERKAGTCSYQPWIGTSSLWRVLIVPFVRLLGFASSFCIYARDSSRFPKPSKKVWEQPASFAEGFRGFFHLDCGRFGFILGISFLPVERWPSG